MIDTTNSTAFLSGEVPITRRELIWGIRYKYDVTKVDTSKITDFNSLLAFENDFNQDISNWDVSQGTNFDFMFQHARHFNQNISYWDMSNAKTLMQMFHRAEAFNQDLSQWDLSRSDDNDSFIDFLYKANSFISPLPMKLENIDYKLTNRTFVPYYQIQDKIIAKHSVMSEFLHLNYQDTGMFSRHIKLKEVEEIVFADNQFLMVFFYNEKKYGYRMTDCDFKTLLNNDIVA